MISDLVLSDDYVKRGVKAFGDTHRQFFEYTLALNKIWDPECFGAIQYNLFYHARRLQSATGPLGLETNKKRVKDLLDVVAGYAAIDQKRLASITKYDRNELAASMNNLLGKADIEWILAVMFARTREQRRYLLCLQTVESS